MLNSVKKNSKLNNNSSNKMEIYGEPVPFNESTWRAALEGKVTLLCHSQLTMSGSGYEPIY